MTADNCGNSLFPCADTAWGNGLLIFFYGYLLGQAANWLSDGAEALMEILARNLIGGILLPFLGAFPESVIIFFSLYRGGTPEQVIQQIRVGIGTLAGSTIMLVTLPWAGSVLIGRCDIRNGVAIDHTCGPWSWKKSWFSQGVTVENDIKNAARICLASSMTYFVIQVPAFLFRKDSSAKLTADENEFAEIGFYLCVAFLLSYMVYTFLVARLEHKADKKEGKSGAPARSGPLETSALLGRQASEVGQGINATGVAVDAEFGVTKATAAVAITVEESMQTPDFYDETTDPAVTEGLPMHPDNAQKSFWKILLKSSFLMLAGGVVIVLFSDPLVGATSAFATDLGTSAFYIAFVTCPMASNAAEVVAALYFARRKKKKNISLTMQALYGSATLNNSMCLGVFLFFAWQKHIQWKFGAEVVSIFVASVLVCVYGSIKTTVKVFTGILFLLVYPLSLALVWFLRGPVGMDK